MLHRQMEQYRDQPQHLEKIAYQQRLLQEDLVHIRAELSRESTVRRGWGRRRHFPSGWAGGGLLFSSPSLQLNWRLGQESWGSRLPSDSSSPCSGVACPGLP